MVPEVEDRSKPRQISSHTIQDGDTRLPSSLTPLQKHYIDYRDLELPTISKYMKDASKRFFDIAGSHPNALLRAAVDYQPPHPTPYPVGLSVSQVIDLNFLTPPPLTASGRQEGEPTRDGFLRHPMPRRLPPGVVHSACHAPSALMCRPAALGETIKVV
ncbi:hypothetical protein EVAR_81702_1 [Eumeta japonica]|uniref:Uncharacterized protein n=1 Tax=Eumeta variegata TaxID=151549 RepID=A0A4C1V2Z6_EUMVA|nr:hypothetical protein EVAR_81702_1 [Eumeta japonica]